MEVSKLRFYVVLRATALIEGLANRDCPNACLNVNVFGRLMPKQMRSRHAGNA